MTEDFDAQRDEMEAALAAAPAPVTVDPGIAAMLAKYRGGGEGPSKLEAAKAPAPAPAPVTVTQEVTAGKPGEGEDFETVADDHWP